MNEAGWENIDKRVKKLHRTKVHIGHLLKKPGILAM